MSGSSFQPDTANSANLALVEKSISLRHEFEVRPALS